MPRIFPFGGRKNSQAPQNSVACFLSSWLLSLGLLFPSSKRLDRPRTNLWLTLSSHVLSPSQSKWEREESIFLTEKPDRKPSSLTPYGSVLWLSWRAELWMVGCRPDSLTLWVPESQHELCSDPESLFLGSKVAECGGSSIILIATSWPRASQLWSSQSGLSVFAVSQEASTVGSLCLLRKHAGVLFV